jgi:hypothetical protein
VYQAVASLFSDATLDLNFAATKTLDPKVTFTRASTGTYVDAAGVIQSAAVNEARFDHDPTTGESLGLLIEESRTNQLKYSGNLDNSPNWTTGGGSPANTTAPDGTNDAVIFTENTATDYHGIVVAGVNRPTMSGNIAASVYIKPGTRRYVLISFGSGTNGVCVTVDTQNMTVSEATAYGTGYTYTNNSATIVSASNGWYRVSFAGNSSGSNAQVFIVRGTNIATGNTFGESYLGDGSTFSVWGAQLEAGSFSTSYIPTNGATATRAVDLAEITGDNFNSWYNNIGGTFCVNCNSADGVNGVFSVGTATNPNEGLNYDFSGFNSLSADVVLNGTINPVGSAHKFAFTSQTGTISLYADGVLQDFDTATNAQRDAIVMTIGNRTTFGGGVGSTYLNGHIARFTYWPTRLTNEQLQEVTQ